MKKCALVSIPVLTMILVMMADAQTNRPKPVSPANEIGIAKVGHPCPTFSWTAVDWATSYRVEVYKTEKGVVKRHQAMAEAAYPVLVKEILGSATSWTPSVDEQLNGDDIYIWYVQAINESGRNAWSPGEVFQIEVALGMAPIEEALTESLEDNGVEREVIEKVIDDLRDKAGGGLQISDDDPKASLQATEESWKTALGYYAGYNNTSSSGTYNTYIGSYAGYDNETGDGNTLVGYQSGSSLTGLYNSMLGYNAGLSHTSGANNTFIGSNAGRSNTTADFNTFLGSHAGYQSTGSSNTFLGYSSGYGNTTGGGNTFIGYSAGHTNTTGGSNIFIGNLAGYANTASYNVFIGTQAGKSNTSGSYNTFLGYRAGQANTIQPNNTFVGYEAGYSNSGGSRNTFLGTIAGYTNSTGYDNTFLGYSAGDSNTSGNHNTFIGSYAGAAGTTAQGNTFVGYYAGYSNSNGNYNTFLGYGAGDSTTASYNTFLGYRAGQANTSGENNVCVGLFAGSSYTTGTQNVCVGNYAGHDNETGDGNLCLGYQAGYNETGSNKLYIDNSDTSDPLIYGEFDNDILAFMGSVGVGTKSPAYPMEMKKTGINAAIVVNRTDGATNFINATDSFGNFGTATNHPLRLNAGAIWRVRINTDNSLRMKSGATCTSGGVWTNASSRDLKDDINDLSAEKAFEALNDLQPVTYKYKADMEDEHVGFIAEDVPDLVASKDRKGMSPMDVVAVLTKVLQEQQKTITELKDKVEKLKKESDK